MISPHAWDSLPDDTLAALWEVHQQAAWPEAIGPHEGELMMLDTVITGCLTYYFEEAEGLDAQRIDILRDSVTELEPLISEVPESAVEYFHRVRGLAVLLLSRHHS